MYQTLKSRVDRSLISPLARRVRDDGLTYLSERKLRSLEAALKRVDRNCRTGDYMEFGVALGGSAILIASLRPPGREFHGYDVFGMIPPPGPEDDRRSHERYAEIRSGNSSGLNGDTYYGYVDDLYGKVAASFAKFGQPVGRDGIRLHKGLFEDTLDPDDTRPVAFAHIDCDWFEPVDYCLRSLHDRLVPGAIVVLDDYNDYGGCRKAVDAWLDACVDTVRALRLEPHAVIERVGS